MSDSTDRMDDNQDTARMDGGTARMDGSQGAGPAAGGNIFADGQTLVLNGKNCVIEKLISMGSGEAVVYKIQIDGKPYTLKHYKPNTPLSETAKKLLAKIRDNPQEKIIKIFDFGAYDGQDFEIMEYAEGGTLGEYVKKKGAIRDANLKGVVKQINEGLRQMHGFYKAIYQDLKPENIFFKDAQKTSLVLADFGISSIMQDSMDEVEVTASVTDLYGAPELARKGNNTNVIVTPAVDYFAFGITVYELWLGKQPFMDIKPTTRERRIQNKDVDFPVDMPGDCKALIQGLLDPLPKDRSGNEHIQKWLKGETFAPESKKPDAVTVYKPLKFGNESASNPKEMAVLMEKYPDAGKDSLYDEVIINWLREAGDLTLRSEIKNVISQYGKDREAGLTAAIYTLDPERPFKSRKGRICKTGEEIADAIMDDQAHYMEDLKKTNSALYIYLSVTWGSQGKEVADTFCRYFKEYSPNRALTLIYLKLQSDGGMSIGSKRYRSADELAQENDKAQIDIIKKAVKEKDSRLLVWLSAEYGDYFKSTEEFGKLNVTEQFFLLGLLPFLSYKELTGNNEAALKDLIDNYPGRSDLFEAYVAQGLPLKGQILDSPAKKTPIDYVVRNFNGLSKKHGIAAINNLIRLLCKLGADVNECSSDNTYTLLNAFNANNNDLVNLLLKLGADRGKYDELVAQRAERFAEKQRKQQEQQQLKYNYCISAGSKHTVGLKADGTVVAVGDNAAGKCNTGGWRGIVAVDTGVSHTVALKADGTVVAVGKNTTGQCNTGGWRDIVAVSAANWYTVALEADGTVVAVGDNNRGQCNTGDWHGIVAVSAGGDYTVALKADGTVVAVGKNDDGQCNTGDWRDIVAVSAGCSHTVGLKADGTVVAVGKNDDGQCNTGGWRDIVIVSAGGGHTVALKADGTVVALGSNTKYDPIMNKDEHCGQCDTGGWRGIVAVAAGSNHTVGLKADGKVVAVGDNRGGMCNTDGWRNIGPVDAVKAKGETTQKTKVNENRR